MSREVQSIAVWILTRREEKGLTQQGLANLCGTSQGIVSRWESGVRVPHARHRDALRLALGKGLPMDDPPWDR